MTAIIVVLVVIILGNVGSFIRRTWRNRGEETWPKKQGMLGLLEIFLFLYAVLSLLAIGIWSLLS